MGRVLTILAYCEEMIPILAEIAVDCGYHPKFRIVQNMVIEKGNCSIDVPGVEYELDWKEEWKFTSNEKLAFSVVQPRSKEKVFEEFEVFGNFRREHYPDLVHPSCFVSRSAKLCGGLIMEPLSVISSHTEIGFGVNIRRGVNIGHHCSIRDYVTINPGANISGKARIGTGVTIGIGAVVLGNIDIGAGSFIGAGSIVTRSVPPGVVAYGNPCKVMSEIDAGKA